ncbi:alpha-1,2-fucosyltransferase [Candidatus Parcubacteria bacterium]|nr:alpha-1,2-fucosyltransferase [Candidatus Parcubacteria bacterium]
MIIVRISGGLGNQMFQYAFARAIKEKTGLEVRLDTDYYTNIGSGEAKRTFELHKFKISLAEASTQDKKNLGFNKMYDKSFLQISLRRIYRIIDAHKPLNLRKIILEPSFTFQKEMTEAIRDNSYISGIWQSEKYFQSIEEIIRNEFSLKHEFSAPAKLVQEIIRKTQAISIHVRRGDYVSNSNTNQKHGTCSPEYYQKAITYICSHISTPHFFVFSDDIAWVESELAIPGNVTYVSKNNIPGPEELLLMSMCKHNIVANSSFSWWGAWLNQNKQKIVIAPQRWFGADINTKDLIPDSWVRV